MSYSQFRNAPHVCTCYAACDHESHPALERPYITLNDTTMDAARKAVRAQGWFLDDNQTMRALCPEHAPRG